LLAGGAAGIAVGAVLGARMREFYLAIGTLALNFTAVVFVVNTSFLGGSVGIVGIPLKTTAGIGLLLLLAAAALVGILERTRLGRAMRAVNEDETMAAANGIDIHLVKIAAFGIGGAIAGLAGALYAHNLGFVRPEEFDFNRSVALWVPVIVGGTVSVLGPVVGAALVTLLPVAISRAPELVSGNRWTIDDLYVSGTLIILAVLFRPGGLVGHREASAPARMTAYLRRRVQPAGAGDGST
jgi:branched-chain amino acid transport system permease protein